MITNKNHNVDLSKVPDGKLMFKFAKEMCFDNKTLGNRSTRDKSVIGLRESPSILASRISTIFLSEDPNELCVRLKSLL